jgi:hypothetical protein
MDYRAAVKAVVDRLVQNSFLTMYRSMIERDRHLYSMLLAIEVVTLCNVNGYFMHF